MAVAWLVVGIVLIAVELSHFAFFALFAAVGAFAAALVAWVAPSAIPLQILVAVLVSALGIWLVRPLVSTAFHRRHDGWRSAAATTRFRRAAESSSRRWPAPPSWCGPWMA